MEGAGGTDRLRILAPNWSLAGDEQLLSILQNTHQRITSKCQEINTTLEEMVTALDDASINLQNVNNKFMALSNSQFIESRVYDDDVDVTTETIPVKEPPKTVPIDDLSSLKRSLAVLETLHSPVTILRDSDTESSDEEQRDRLVLKPKDMYADRPLPYIIGSQAWKSKWHAGLVVEESDTDSTTSKHADRDSEQYSDSEPELGDTANIRTGTLNIPDTTISETSSELPSEQDVLPPVVAKQTPSDIAAELARRLGGHPAKVTVQEPEYSPPNPIVKKIYRPEQPATGTIFFDEPPPIDQYQSDGENSEEDNDIFAELHKNKPYFKNNKEQSRLADDLFGLNSNAESNKPHTEGNRVGNTKGDIFSHFSTEKMSNPIANQKTTLFDDEPEPELFANKPQSEPVKQIVESENTGVKKPVGGISLFGTNKGAESIGAAILNRNRRKLSTSDEESGSDDRLQVTKPQTKSIGEINTIKKEKDIFDDLFAKSERTQKTTAEKVKQDKVKKDVKDLFNDNLFDDIDDIFTTNIVKIPVKKAENSQKSLFSDEDELFADIPLAKQFKNEATSNKYNKKGLFDSDDDLFTEKESIPKQSNNVKRHSDSVKITKEGETSTKSGNYKNENILKNDNIEKHEESNSLSDKPKVIENPEHTYIKAKEIKSIFDSDGSDNDTDRFSSKIKNDKYLSKPVNTANNTENPYTSSNNIESVHIFKNNIPGESQVKSPGITPINEALKVIPITKNTFQSPLLFEDDEINDVFVNTSKLDIQYTYLPEEAKTDKENVDKVSNLIEEADVIDNNTVDNDTDFNNKSIEEYVIPDKMDDDEIFKSVETDNKDMFDNNQIIETKESRTLLKKPHTDSIGETIKDKVVTKTAQICDPFISTNSTIETQSDFDCISEPLQSKVHGIDNSKTDTYSSISKKTDKLSEDEGALFSMPEKDKVDIFDNFKTEDNTVFPISKESVSNKSNIFDDIFSEPPAFEKPKEPKKSKNINALFDDDSDDEALFFKKNDVVTDEPPENLTVNLIKDQFGLFHDEPPAIDVEVGPETSKNYNIGDMGHNKLSSMPISTEISKNVLLFCNSKFEESLIETDKLAKSQQNPAVGQKKESVESTKIEKINTKKININVNALLPGASPKKYQRDQTDGQTISASNEELSIDKIESKMVKSISFEAEPDSEILDNKLSKQRARIQIKRRPSSRRARHEAVRKSGINFGDDSTDNSSSIDDPPKHRGRINKVNNGSKTNTAETSIEKPQKNLENETKKVNQDTQIKGNTTKIVYILNDEDIFNINQDSTKRNEIKNKVLNVVDDKVDLVKSHNTESNITDGIKTLGKAYLNQDETTSSKNAKTEQKETEAIPKKTIFDLSDEENLLFTKNRKPVSKSTIFDSDSEEELFAGKNKKMTAVEKKREVVKGSLFGDDDDDDLFGAKTKKDIPQTANAKISISKEINRPTEPVFGDPLSMLGSDD